MKEAEDIYRDLLKRNPENWSYYRKVEECLKLGLFLPYFDELFDVQAFLEKVCDHSSMHWYTPHNTGKYDESYAYS